jgi:hypothetical protein
VISRTRGLARAPRERHRRTTDRLRTPLAPSERVAIRHPDGAGDGVDPRIIGVTFSDMAPGGEGHPTPAHRGRSLGIAPARSRARVLGRSQPRARASATGASCPGHLDRDAARGMDARYRHGRRRRLAPSLVSWRLRPTRGGSPSRGPRSRAVGRCATRPAGWIALARRARSCAMPLRVLDAAGCSAPCGSCCRRAREWARESMVPMRMTTFGIADRNRRPGYGPRVATASRAGAAGDG